jgi:hypothetical protein
LIVLSLEGLAASALGCYGSSWNDTPTLDSLASTGCVWDRFVATTDRPASVLEQWTGKDVQWADAWRPLGSIELITDGDASDFHGSCFDEVLSLATETPASDSSPAADIVETQLGQLIAAAIERDAESPPWSVMWLHSRFLTNCWDAPRDLVADDDELLDSYMDDELAAADDQSMAEGEIESPADAAASLELETLRRALNKTMPPSITLDTSTDPDLVTTWMRTYACQVKLIDLLLEVLLQSIHVESPIVAVTGTSGFRLGQNGLIGHRIGSLRSPDVRLPLLVNCGGPLHIPHLTASTRFAAILEQLGSPSETICPPEQWSRRPRDLTGFEIESDRASVASHHPEWFYVQDIDLSEHLFLKPDDIEDFNDVGRLRADVLETFRPTKE